jgi:hypothetical protein
MNFGWNLAHGEAIKIDRSSGLPRWIGTHSESFGDRWNRQWIDECLEPVDPQGAMNQANGGRGG